MILGLHFTLSGDYESFQTLPLVLLMWLAVWGGARAQVRLPRAGAGAGAGLSALFLHSHTTRVCGLLGFCTTCERILVRPR